MRRLLAAFSLFAAGAAAAQSVSFNGAMGDRALLVIDGQPRTVALGATVQGIKLLGLSADEARIEAEGQQLVLRLGTPARLKGMAEGGAARVIVMTAGLGGHYVSGGAINGRPVQFMVDTGASVVAISQAEADRIGLDYRHGTPIMIGTANGNAPGMVVVLNSVRVGEVEVYNVQAVVTPGDMPQVLLGNSFLSRFQMRQDNGVLRLERKF